MIDEKRTRLYGCTACKWPERMRGQAWGMFRPRCPWVQCEHYGLLMEVDSV